MNSLRHENQLTGGGSGSNGVDSISFGFSSRFAVASFAPQQTYMSVNTNFYSSSFATINGVTGSLFHVMVGNGTGIMYLYDFTRNLIAVADLIGYVEVTSVGPGAMWDETIGTYSIYKTNPLADITHAPEPSTFVLMLTALVIFGWLVRFYSEELTKPDGGGAEFNTLEDSSVRVNVQAHNLLLTTGDHVVIFAPTPISHVF